jgi:cytochrome c oxidase subunit 1
VTLLTNATTPVQFRRPKPTPGQAIGKVLTTTDHKTIGLLYLVTSFLFFLAAGLMALIMRAELGQPGLQVVTAEQYNQLFTMHGTIMMFLFAPPAPTGSRTSSCRCRSARRT